MKVGNYEKPVKDHTEYRSLASRKNTLKPKGLKGKRLTLGKVSINSCAPASLAACTICLNVQPSLPYEMFSAIDLLKN